VCSKRVKGKDVLQDETMVLIKRNDKGKSKEGDVVELNTPLLLRASKR
jgi:hypothetical protein